MKIQIRSLIFSSYKNNDKINRVYGGKSRKLRVIKRGRASAEGSGGHIFSAAGQGRVIQRVGSPSRKVGRPPGSESLEADW